MLKDQHLFCFGLGYCANVLSNQLKQVGWKVSGTSQSENSSPTIHMFTGDQPMVLASDALAGISHILISIPPGTDQDPTLEWHKTDILKLKSLQWVGYLSTTGVYGNTDGEWVDETSTTNPTSPRSQSRLNAETEWLNLFHENNVPVHVFRLPGIYGPGRSALDQVQKGRARRIDKPGHKFSRIHVADIANTITQSMACPNPGRIYNVCDNEAAPPAEVTAYACKLLDVPVPNTVPYEIAAQDMSPMALSFWQDNRRVDNTRITSELSVQLKYPTYRDGLKAIFDMETET
ncbi:MAG: SDR family oxidoreductase [Rhodospirillales bacterium]